LLGRASIVLAAAFVLVGAPLVAHALDSDPLPDATTPTSSAPETARREVTAPGATSPAPPPRIAAARTPARPAVERVPEVPAPEAPAPEVGTAAVLTRAYEWDERSTRVVELQEALGVTADGWYAAATQRAHRTALEAVGLPTDRIPAVVLPPGPAPSQWAALRECESGGDYTITNPSGKYRGAYQFDRSTWNSVAGRHDPSLVGVDPAAASPADQDAMALALYVERGAQPWPHCGRHLR
jgi:hypothetical protein